uniref:Uncharacterized protein n=1 Tax=Arundo donax TaxID=35708 RepID=A0A0A9H8P8_ARUDO
MGAVSTLLSTLLMSAVAFTTMKFMAYTSKHHGVDPFSRSY